MESQEEVLYKNRLPEDVMEEGLGRYWIMSTLVLMSAVVLGLCCSLLLFVMIFSKQSAKADCTTVDTLASFYSKRTRMHIITSQMRTTPSHSRNTSVTYPDRGQVVPTSRSGKNICTGPLCRFLAEWLRHSIDYTVDPCDDFYKYVCASFRGQTMFRHVATAIDVSTLTDLVSTQFPASNQLSWQKAAAMYQACMSFTSAHETETSDLITWMKSLSLDLLNRKALATVNPVEMMVRGSLDLGVEAVISITFHDKAFQDGKRLMQMDYSKQQDLWRSENHGLNDYVLFLAEFGATTYLAYDLASKLRGYENQLEGIAKATLTGDQTMEYVFEMSFQTDPYVSLDDWETFLKKYTNRTYRASDKMLYREDIGRMLAELFESSSVGKEGLQYLVAWTFYRQLFQLTDPIWFLRGRSANDACYEHVKKVMKLAITSHHFQSVVPLRMITQTKRMTSRIRTAFEEALQSSSWLTPEIRALAINRLIDITVHIGSPGQRLDPDYVEELYKIFPDVPLDRLFPTWIKYLSLNTHLTWSDQKTILYDETNVNAYFSPTEVAVFIPTAMLHRPFLYLYGPNALNYGGLGTTIGHEFMHAFDVRNTIPSFWHTESIKQEYTDRAICLRRSHKSVLSLSLQEDILNDTTDSENLADFVGAKVAYAAYSSLPRNFKSGTIAGLNVSSEQLFFVSRCLKFCAQLIRSTERYAPYRSRCNVPLMNMPEFSSAYGCPAGTPMNPRNKCKFW